MNTQGFSLHRGRDKVFFLGWYFKKKGNSHHNKQKINYVVNLFFSESFNFNMSVFHKHLHHDGAEHTINPICSTYY